MNPFKRLCASSVVTPTKTKPVFSVVVINETDAAIPYVSSKEPRYSIYPVVTPKLLTVGEVLEGVKMTVEAASQSMILECDRDKTEGTTQRYIFPVEGVSWKIEAKVS